MAKVPSISGARQEKLSELKLYEIFRELNYFKEHKEQLTLIPVEGDYLERNVKRIESDEKETGASGSFGLLLEYQIIYNYKISGQLRGSAAIIINTVFGDLPAIWRQKIQLSA